MVSGGATDLAKKLYIKTYGCQMNVYDSARMAETLTPLGYALADAADGANMIILNTCHIRENASEKVFSELGRLRCLKERMKKAGEQMIIAVAGCVAQAAGEEIFRRAPFVDMVFGPQAYHRLPAMLAQAERAGGGVLDTDFPPESKFDHLPEASTVERGSAFLAAQEGCDKFCSFCVVPYTRGGERSRPAAAVINEAKRLVALGALEIVLLGQNINCYHGESPDGLTEWRLSRLIAELALIDGLQRIRYTTSYPAEMTDDLITAHGSIQKLMPFLHLPAQSGSDLVLEAMNRRHSADDYRRLIGKLRRAREDLAISSDFIVGFPGETDGDFQASLKLIRDIGFAQAYSFKYSLRPGTPASLLDNQVADYVKEERLAILQELLKEQQTAFNKSCEGQVMPILLDRLGRRDGQLVGRSPYMQPVHVEESGLRLGEIVHLHIKSGFPNSLAGVVLNSAAALQNKMACA